jgi:8-oxo-dGTP diphosphatase
MEELVAKAKADGIRKMVVGAVIVEGGRVLVAQRAKNDFMGGLWELPSGTVDPGETLLGALTREIKEETGLMITSVMPGVKTFDYISGSGKRTRQFSWKCYASGDVRLSHEHSDHKWLKPSELDAYNISRETKATIRALM